MHPLQTQLHSTNTHCASNRFQVALSVVDLKSAGTGQFSNHSHSVALLFSRPLMPALH